MHFTPPVSSRTLSFSNIQDDRGNDVVLELKCKFDSELESSKYNEDLTAAVLPNKTGVNEIRKMVALLEGSKDYEVAPLFDEDRRIRIKFKKVHGGWAFGGSLGDLVRGRDAIIEVKPGVYFNNDFKKCGVFFKVTHVTMV